MNENDAPRTPDERAPTPLRKLSRVEAVELTTYLSALARAELPLARGLRAMSSDLTPDALPAAHERLASALESGQPLETALGCLQLPGHVRSLMLAGARSDQLAQTLDGLLVHERAMNDLSRKLWQTISYPLLLFGFLVLWLLFIALWIVPSMEASSVLSDMDELTQFGRFWNNLKEERPTPYSERLLEFAQIVPLFVLVVGGTLLVAIVLARLLGGRAMVSQVVALVPLIGPACRYRSLAEFSGFLSLFLRQQLGLSKSLELTAAAARDGAMRDVAQLAATQTSDGQTLSQCLSRRSSIPPTVVNLVAWGEHHAALAEALDSARRMMIERFELQLRLIRLTVPPLVFLLVMGSALFVSYGWFDAVTRAIRMLAVVS
jgi:type II secretory pathway component PulF